MTQRHLLTYFAYHIAAGVLKNSMPLLLLVTGCTYFLCNTVPLAIVIALVRKTLTPQIWKETLLLDPSLQPGRRRLVGRYQLLPIAISVGRMRF
jgi:hypothetical protein